MVKKCKICLLEKDVSFFRLNKKYYENTCKICNYKIGSQKRKTEEHILKIKFYYNKNKQKINERRRNKYVKIPRKPKQAKELTLKKIREWQKNNKEKRKAIVNRYHDTHKEAERLYYENNREKIIERNKKYYLKNKKIINEKTRLRRKDPFIKMRHSVSTLIRMYIQGIKIKSFKEHLPYSVEELKLHIERQFEPWMSWNNWGKYNKSKWNDQDQSTWTWQLDHIIPHSDFIYSSMNDENFKRCWSLDNLRPYSAKLNMIDGSRKTRHLNKARCRKKTQINGEVDW